MLESDNRTSLAPLVEVSTTAETSKANKTADERDELLVTFLRYYFDLQVRQNEVDNRAKPWPVC